MPETNSAFVDVTDVSTVRYLQLQGFEKRSMVVETPAFDDLRTVGIDTW